MDATHRDVVRVMRCAFASWNAAAVNSNPFEYYGARGSAVEAFLRACEDALALANASDVVDPFGMLARGARGRME